MRVKIILILLIACIITGVCICVITKIDKYLKVVICIGLLCLFLFSSSIVNLNSLSEEKERKLDKVVESCGNTYIKTKGSHIYVSIDGKWVDIDDISVVGTFTRDCTITYDGRVVKIGESGVKSTIKTMEYVGLLKSK